MKMRVLGRAKLIILLSVLLGVGMVYSSTNLWTAQAAGTISGVVFIDYNMNGVRDTTGTSPSLAVDGGLGNVTVTVYAANGTSRAATTASDGTYSINTSTAPALPDGPYRIEFTNLPTGYYPSATGTNNASTVRFAANGTSTGNDLGVIYPSDYCQINPLMINNVYGVGTGPFDTIVKFPYNYSEELDGRLNSVDPTAWTNPPSRDSLLAPTGLATVDQVGATFGLTFNNRTSRLYSSAYLKRGARFGTLSNESTGAIYVTNNPASNSPTNALYADLNAAFGAGTAGANPHPAATTIDWTDDAATIPLVGKRGLGGLTVALDGTKLYTVNLNDKRLYVVPTTGTLNSTTITRFDIPTANLATSSGNCAAADVRPFAVGRDRSGQIYVGAVCSAESETTDAKLHAFVWRFTGSAFTLVANNNLTFSRIVSSTQIATWQRWANVVNVINRAAPVLTDIEFDGADMLLGFRDRYGDQVVLPEFYRGYGDIMRVCNVAGTFTFESNGTCGTVTSTNPGASNNNSGNGGREFYTDLNGDGREEGGLGGLTQIPGYNHVITSFYDPVTYNSAGTRVSNFYTSGIQRYNNRTGIMTGAYDVYLDADPGTFGKADGAGDTDVLCNAAPIQIGNRVWNDANSNGRQDPGEGGIPNVAVQLWEDTTGNGIVDSQVAGVNSNANGEYYFGKVNCNITTVTSSITASSDDAEQSNSNGSVLLNGTSFDIAQQGTTLQTLGLRFQNLNIPKGATITSAKVQFTTNTVSTNNSVNVLIQGQSSDSPGTFTTATNNISNTTNRPRTSSSVAWNGVPQWGTSGASGAGQMTPDVSAVIQEIVNRTNWASGNNLALILTDNSSTSGASRSAHTFDSGTAAQRPTLTVTYTLPNGDCYDVKPNTKYEVRIPSANFNTGQPLNTFSPTAALADATPNGILRDSNGIVTTGNQVVTSLTTGDIGQNNHSYDFGFISDAVSGAKYSVGNRVWFDTNNNGRIDTGEVGISGTSVSLTNTSNVASLTQDTDGSGYYRFDNQLSATYRVRTNSANFADGALISGYRNSSVTVNDKTTDSDATNAGENGINPTVTGNSVQTDGISSGDIALNTEPTGETDVQANGQGNLDNRANMTVDFGFYQACLTGTVWNDADNDGLLGVSENGIKNVIVQIFDSSNIEIPVGADGLLGTADDLNGGLLTNPVAGSLGNYSFCGLSQGQYRIVVTPSGGTSSDDISTTANPDNNVDSDDNGVLGAGTFSGKVVSNLVTLTPGNKGLLNNNTVINSNGLTSNPTIDFGFRIAPTAVRLDKFEAFTDGDGVRLEWTTGGESKNLGFNIYRESKGRRELVNSTLIAGSAIRTSIALQASGDIYGWTDNGFYAVNPTYWLEDIDLDGTKTLHGPIVPSFKISLDKVAPNAKLLTELINPARFSTEKVLVGENASEVARTQGSIERQRQIATQEGVKISVRQDGWYHVTAEKLQNSGFDTSSSRDVWQLFAGAEEIPLQVNDDGSIEFFGRGLDTVSTDTQVYYLVRGTTAGQRIIATNGARASEPPTVSSFPVTVERKDKINYISSIINGDGENWFGDLVLKNTPTEQVLNVQGLSQEGKIHLSLKLQALTDFEHLVNLRFNDFQLGTVSYEGLGDETYEFDLPLSAVVEGENRLYLQSAGEGNDISMVDTIRLSYQRKFKAFGDKLRFGIPAGQTVSVEGFSTPNVNFYEVRGGTVANLVEAAAVESDGSYAFTFAPENSDREVLALANGVNEIPAAVERNIPSNLSSRRNSADFVIITPEMFRSQAEKLAEIRRSQGLRTRVVAVENIFDENSFGSSSPEAVRQFLQTAQENWQIKPRFVLLFGDSSYDPRGFAGQADRNLVPTKLLDTESMETTSDAWLADFDDDGIEDIALGRLPAGNQAEANSMLGKLVRYDAQKTRSQRFAVLVSDRGFKDYSDILQAQLPTDVQASHIDRSVMTDAEMNQAIIAQANEGPSVLAYNGHGSTGLWASSDVFIAPTALGLTNEKLSFVMLLTCLNGYNSNASYSSLAESFFKAENGGAYAVWASSGVTRPDAQLEIGQPATAELFSSTDRMRLGDILRNAKQNTNNIDVRLTWSLLGDPTVYVK